jgi:hypothetical protein
LSGLAPVVLGPGPAAVPDPTMAVVMSGIRYSPEADGGID